MLDLVKNKVDILGSDYLITFKNVEDDDYAREHCLSGYTDHIEKTITIINQKSFDSDGYPVSDERNEKEEKIVLRHELIHAFLTESGLKDNCHSSMGSWATNEEMVDWFALQMPKIFKLFKELEIL